MATVVRDDLSDKLIHLTKGEGSSAFATFYKIIEDRALLGGSGYIKDSIKCVCFSEAPISKLPQILATPHENFRYRPYGFMFPKKWVFERGGLPVIYQTDGDYKKLPESKRHLHVRFDLGTYLVDHTWEREWRIRTDRLPFDPGEVSLVMPTRAVSDELRKQWFLSEEKRLAADPSATRTDYPWHHVVLEDLGVPIPDYLD